jgi:dTDP-4-amino-4,6-dideoxygalactose transaminase
LDNFTIDIWDIESKITSRTKAIIPVHLYWYSCYMKEILELAEKYWLKIVEDASHAFWWEHKWKKLWTFWDVWVFSCHLSKNFWTFWNGGIFYTKDKDLYDKLSNYIFPDTQDKKVLDSWRTPADIWPLDAIVLLLKLKYIDKIIGSNIELYNKVKNKYKDKWFVFPKLDLENNKLHIRNFVVLSKNNRSRYINLWLWKQYYDTNLAKNWIFWDDINLENTKKFFRENLALNFYFDFL